MYDQIVAMLREHNTIPSFMSGGKNDITKELAYKDGKYSITLTDSNGVLSDYSFSSSDSNVSVSKSGNKLTISSTVAISGSVRITAKRNNVPTVSSSANLSIHSISENGRKPVKKISASATVLLTLKVEVQSPYNRITISYNRKGHRAFAVFLLSIFVGKCRRAVSDMRCRSPPLHLDFLHFKNSDGRYLW